MIQEYQELAREKIPSQLHQEEFILLKEQGKRPIHKWKKGDRARTFSVEHPRLAVHLRDGGNLAVLCRDELAVLDIDELDPAKTVLEGLPKTFAVETGSGGYHLYYRVKGLGEKIVLETGEHGHIGELQAAGDAYAACPPSIHPNGKPYRIHFDAPIAAVGERLIRRELAPLGAETLGQKEARRMENDWREAREERDTEKELWQNAALSGQTGLDADKVKEQLPALSTLVGHEGHGAHPVHGSTTGKNLHVEDGEGWYCYRCSGGGHALEWVAVEGGIIGCGEELRGEEFKEAVERAAEIAGVDLG